MEKVWEHLKVIESRSTELRKEAQKAASGIIKLASQEAEKLVTGSKVYAHQEAEQLYNGAIALANQNREQQLSLNQQEAIQLRRQAEQHMEKATDQVVAVVLGDKEP